MQKIFHTPSGRMMLASFALTLSASALHVLMHSTLALALFVPFGVALGFMATAKAVADKQLNTALGLVAALPVLLILLAVGIGVGAEQYRPLGYLFGALALVAAALALTPASSDRVTS